MNTDETIFAAGPRGIALRPEGGARIAVPGRAPDTAPALGESEQRALIEAALIASPLRDIAAGKRRAVILAGDLARPAPYDIVLPALVAALVKMDIRPSRIAVAACPGGAGPLLGRAAIHRYGEEICGDHEVAAWPNPGTLGAGTPGDWFDTADLKIAVAPRVAGLSFNSFLPPYVSVDFSLELGLGKKIGIDLEFVRHREPGSAQKDDPSTASTAPACDVLLTSGGGAPWEETLEEALLSLHLAPCVSKTAVLIFSGVEGLGSGRFTRDVWDLIDQAQEFLAGGGLLPAPANGATGARFDPAAALAACLSRYSNTVLFAPELLQHPEGEDLLERLDAAPLVGARLALIGAQADLWKALALRHGPEYSVSTQPLGWRGA